MPITDIVNRIDSVPDAGVGRLPSREGNAAFRDVNASKYRKALSRSLNDATPQPSTSQEADPSRRTAENALASPRATSGPPEDVQPDSSSSGLSASQTSDASNSETHDEETAPEGIAN